MFTKNRYRGGGDCLKDDGGGVGGGPWTVCRFKGGLGKEEGCGVFEGGGGGLNSDAHYALTFFKT